MADNFFITVDGDLAKPIPHAGLPVDGPVGRTLLSLILRPGEPSIEAS